MSGKDGRPTAGDPGGPPAGTSDSPDETSDSPAGTSDSPVETADSSGGADSSDGASGSPAGEWVAFAREVLSSAAAVVAVGLLLFAVSGVWPPMVAVESGSMEPNLQRGDLVFVTEPGRFVPEYDHGDTGVVTASTAEEAGYTSLGGAGSVIVYDFPENGGSPIIHRARFHVERGENWYDRANPEYVGDAADCEELANCPAPHAGFVTKGDNPTSNAQYDQASGLAPVVRESWVRGVAHVRVPYLGWVRLLLSTVSTTVDAGDGAVFAGVETGVRVGVGETALVAGGSIGTGAGADIARAAGDADGSKPGDPEPSNPPAAMVR